MVAAARFDIAFIPFPALPDLFEEGCDVSVPVCDFLLVDDDRVSLQQDIKNYLDHDHMQVRVLGIGINESAAFHMLVQRIRMKATFRIDLGRVVLDVAAVR